MAGSRPRCSVATSVAVVAQFGRSTNFAVRPCVSSHLAPMGAAVCRQPWWLRWLWGSV